MRIFNNFRSEKKFSFHIFSKEIFSAMFILKNKIFFIILFFLKYKKNKIMEKIKDIINNSLDSLIENEKFYKLKNKVEEKGLTTLSNFTKFYKYTNKRILKCIIRKKLIPYVSKNPSSARIYSFTIYFTNNDGSIIFQNLINIAQNIITNGNLNMTKDNFIKKYQEYIINTLFFSSVKQQNFVNKTIKNKDSSFKDTKINDKTVFSCRYTPGSAATLNSDKTGEAALDSCTPNSAPPGTLLTITGQNFITSGTNTIYFQLTTDTNIYAYQTATVITSTSMTVISPNTEAGTYTLVYLNDYYPDCSYPIYFTLTN